MHTQSLRPFLSLSPSHLAEPVILHEPVVILAIVDEYLLPFAEGPAGSHAEAVIEIVVAHFTLEEEEEEEGGKQREDGK